MTNENVQMYINILIYSRPSHYFTLYKDKLLWDYTVEFLRRFYLTQEFILKIPKIIAYYKNYIQFFCRPFLLSFGFAEILQGFLDQKAELFYKQVYGHLNAEEELDGDKEEDGDRHRDKEREEHEGEELGTIFNTSARKMIDCNVLTTIDFLPTQSDNREMIISLCDTRNINGKSNSNEDFFTIEPKNDFLIDLLNKLTYKKAKASEGRNRPSLYDYTIGKGYEYRDIISKDFLHNKNKEKNIKEKLKINKHIQMSQDLNNQHRNNPIKNLKETETYKTKTGSDNKQIKTQLKSNYCNLYKPKAIPPFDHKSYKKKLANSNITSTVATNTAKAVKNKDNNTLHLFSPKYQAKSNFNEWKKINNANKSTSKSRKNSIVGKSHIVNGNNTQQQQNKTTQFKYSMERPKSNVSNASNTNNHNGNAFNVNPNKTLNKKMKHSIMEDKDMNDQRKKMINFKKITKNKTCSHIIPSYSSNTSNNINPRLKKCLSPSTSTNNNLLINYLHNCSNSRQSKRYFSLRNNSNEKSLPLPSSSNPTHNPCHRKSASNQINTSYNIPDSNQQSKPKPKLKSKSNSKFLYKKISFKPNKNTSNPNKREVNLNVNVNLNNIHININTSILNNITMTTSSNAKGMIYRNKSHSNVFNEKMKSHNPSEVEKLINGIKMNLNSNRIVNDIIKINKKGSGVSGGNTLNVMNSNKNDSTQTSSNTHTNQGYAPSKSPKRIDSKKSGGGIVQIIEDYVQVNSKNKNVKSNKQSRRTSPGSLVNMFFSQRKQEKE